MKKKYDKSAIRITTPLPQHGMTDEQIVQELKESAKRTIKRWRREGEYYQIVSEEISKSPNRIDLYAPTKEVKILKLWYRLLNLIKIRKEKTMGTI